MRTGERYPPDGPTSSFLLVHGSGCSPASFDRLLSHLPPGTDAAVPALPGHAGEPEGPAPWTPRATAHRLLEVLHGAAAQPVVLIGHSMGGVIATEMAISGRVCVRGLVVLDPAYGAEPEELRRADEALARTEVEGIVEARERIRAATSPSVDPALHSRAAQDLLHSSPAVRAGWYRAQYLDDGSWAARDLAPAVLDRRQVPVLALYPSEQRAATEREAALRARAARRPAVEVRVLEGGGHFLHEEAPQWCARRIVRWVGGLPPLTEPRSPDGPGPLR